MSCAYQNTTGSENRVSPLLGFPLRPQPRAMLCLKTCRQDRVISSMDLAPCLSTAVHSLLMHSMASLHLLTGPRENPGWPSELGVAGWDQGPFLPDWRAGLSLAESSPSRKPGLPASGPHIPCALHQLSRRTMGQRICLLQGRKVGQGLPLDGVNRPGSGHSLRQCGGRTRT